jgi:hypothetical protein
VSNEIKLKRNYEPNIFREILKVTQGKVAWVQFQEVKGSVLLEPRHSSGA